VYYVRAKYGGVPPTPELLPASRTIPMKAVV